MEMTKATKAFFEKHYRLWRNDQDRGKDTQGLYADYLDVKLDTLKNWINRGTTPSRDMAPQIAIKCDFEIYDLLGMPRPDPLLQIVMRGWERVPDAVQKEIVETIERAEARRTVGESDKGVAAPKRRRAQSN